MCQRPAAYTRKVWVLVDGTDGLPGVTKGEVLHRFTGFLTVKLPTKGVKELQVAPERLRDRRGGVPPPPPPENFF